MSTRILPTAEAVRLHSYTAPKALIMIAVRTKTRRIMRPVLTFQKLCN